MIRMENTESLITKHIEDLEEQKALIDTTEEDLEISKLEKELRSLISLRLEKNDSIKMYNEEIAYWQSVLEHLPELAPKGDNEPIIETEEA